jgi:hypothetical protein
LASNLIVKGNLRSRKLLLDEATAATAITTKAATTTATTTEAAATATVTAKAAATTATTTEAATAAATTTVTAEAAATTTATTKAATATATTTVTASVVATGGVVNAHLAAVDQSAGHGHSLLGSVSLLELDVTVALGAAALAVHGDAHGGDGAARGKGLGDHVLVGAPRQVADEAGGAALRLLGSLLAERLVAIRLRLGVRGQLDADVAAAQLGAVGGAGSLGLLLRLEVDESDALRLALLVQRDLDGAESQ